MKEKITESFEDDNNNPELSVDKNTALLELRMASKIEEKEENFNSKLQLSFKYEWMDEKHSKIFELIIKNRLKKENITLGQ